MDKVFKALADRTRRELLDRLMAKPGQTLGELCSDMSTSRQSISKHLGILESAGIVEVSWNGREKQHFLNPIPINEISERWIKKFEKQRIDALRELKTRLEDGVKKNENG